MHLSPQARPGRATLLRWLPWPAPALLAWGLAWWVFGVALSTVNNAGLRFALASAVGALCAAAVASVWRRAIVALGFPVSGLVLGFAPSLPGWAWLLALLLLALMYPVRAWRDAPFFPTRRGALTGLDKHVAVSIDANILDAGCGLGHGLQALRAVWPQARFHGIEWSRGLACLAHLRCPWAQVKRGDMWGLSWANFDVVYVFQRPESMARALAKARSEMHAGAWLVSLEFEVPDEPPHARLSAPGERVVWVYGMPVNGPVKEPVKA